VNGYENFDGFNVTYICLFLLFQKRACMLP